MKRKCLSDSYEVSCELYRLYLSQVQKEGENIMTAIIGTTNVINGTNWRGFTGAAFHFTCGIFANIGAAQRFLSCDTGLSDHSGHSSGPGTS